VLAGLNSDIRILLDHSLPELDLTAQIRGELIQLTSGNFLVVSVDGKAVKVTCAPGIDEGLFAASLGQMR
jgi:hypothetical protein